VPADVRPVLTIIAVNRLEEAAAFYRAAFEWKLEVETPVYVELRAPGGHRVGLYQRDGFARNTGVAPLSVAPGELAPVELYLHTDDLDAAMDRLRAAGARELSPRAVRPWGDEAAYYADPAGTVLAIARPLSADGARRR
jgi:predicted enzyme related to lactoylglutathione lyase